MKTILFVCTGNTCRSPMAEALLREKIAADKLQHRFAAASAGLSVYSAAGATANACAVMQAMGLSLAEHQAAPLSLAMLAEADLVLTMTARHSEAVLQAVPAARGKVFALTAYAGTAGEIADPYGGDLARYQQCCSDLQKNIHIIWKKIKQAEAE